MSIKFFKKKRNNKFEEIIAEEHQDIEQEEREMIRGIIELSETTVRSIMIPRTDVVAIPVDEDFNSMIRTIMKSGHSRIPVYEETIDNVIGFLYAKDLLPSLLKGEKPSDIKKILRPVRFVPEGKMIKDLLKELQQKRDHIAIVVDEYGGTAGIVCLEDILEEIVGEIQDEYDDEEEEINKISSDTYICDARIQLEDINEELGLTLPLEGSDTLGGFVFDMFGKIPFLHEEIEHDNTVFRIEAMNGHRIIKVRIRKNKSSGETESSK
jgi:CBS domain containing-hemolysin-like protein